MAKFFSATQVLLNGNPSYKTVYLNSNSVLDATAITYISNYYTLTFDAALVASNKINGKVNGSSITEVTYASSNNATLDSIATNIAAKTGVLTAVRSGTRTIIVYPTNPYGFLSLTNWAVTAGASQATITVSTVNRGTSTDANSVLTGCNILMKHLDGSTSDAIIVKETLAAITTARNADLGTHGSITAFSGTFVQGDGTSKTEAIQPANIYWFWANTANTAYTDFFIQNPTNTELSYKKCTSGTNASTIASVLNGN